MGKFEQVQAGLQVACRLSAALAQLLNLLEIPLKFRLPGWGIRQIR